jgi:predicted PurR-regulated permease PerM
VQPDPPSTRPTLLTYAALTLGVVVPLATMVAPYAVSLLTGMILAVLCYPLYARMRRRLPRWAAGLVVTVGAVILVVAPVIGITVGAVRQGAVMLGQMSAGDAPTMSEVIEVGMRWLPVDLFGTPDEVHAMIQGGVDRLSASVTSRLIQEVQALPDRVLQLVIVTLSTYFLLVDGRRLFTWIAEKLQLSRHIRELLVASFREATTAVVLASVLAAAAQASILGVSFLVLGVPAALLGGGASFVLAWIPTVGTLPVWASAAIYPFVQGSTPKAVGMIAVGLVVGLVDNVVRPAVLRGRQEMHPMVSLIAIIGGIAALGLPGVFIGPLLASVAISALDLWPAVASFCGIPVTGAGEQVPDVPMLTPPDR